MKRNLFLLLVINTSIFLLSCASLNQHSSEKVTTKTENDLSGQRLSKEEIANAVHAKVDSREYRIDIKPEIYVSEDGACQYVPGYIQVRGDSVISCMTYDNPFPGELPPKNYIENMQGVKYEILDYQQTEIGGGRRIISFWFKIKYEGDDPYTLAKFKDRLVPIRYKLEFGNSTRVRVLLNEFLTFGTLSL